jgi:hypothetical protein
MSKKPKQRAKPSGRPGPPASRDRAERSRGEEAVSPLIAEVCAGIDAFLEAAKAGKSLEGLCTIRTRQLGGGDLNQTVGHIVPTSKKTGFRP